MKKLTHADELAYTSNLIEKFESTLATKKKKALESNPMTTSVILVIPKEIFKEMSMILVKDGYIISGEAREDEVELIVGWVNKF